MTAYGSFRAPFSGAKDTRIVYHGICYIIENYVAVPWTIEELDEADDFFKTFGPGESQHPFPREIFEKFILENDGFMPVKIESLPEGTVVYPGTPVYQITAEGVYAPLVTFLETILTMVWYPSTVATLSRISKEIIRSHFIDYVDEDSFWKLDFRLHDFGFRGCTCYQQAVIGGSAHLLNFKGSDTLAACWNVKALNNGKPRGSSIPATEHSVMTHFKNEEIAFDHVTKLYTSDSSKVEPIFATVMDSYDYEEALRKYVPMFAKRVVDANGVWILRPDSGDVVVTVIQALEYAEKALLSLNIEGLVYKNSKGKKVLKNINVIQGDGINMDSIIQILKAVVEAGYSPENVAFGMGGGLLQKVNRDTMSFATKLSEAVFDDGTVRPVMKAPKTDGLKVSLPGKMKICMNSLGYPEARTLDEPGDNLFEVVYESGFQTTYKWPIFDEIVDKIEMSYKTMESKINGAPYSETLKSKQKAVLNEIRGKRSLEA